MVARVGKLDDVHAVPGFALTAAPSRFGSDTDLRRSTRSRCYVRSIRLYAALSNKRIQVTAPPMAVVGNEADDLDAHVRQARHAGRLSTV